MDEDMQQPPRPLPRAETYTPNPAGTDSPHQTAFERLHGDVPSRLQRPQSSSNLSQSASADAAGGNTQSHSVGRTPRHPGTSAYPDARRGSFAPPSNRPRSNSPTKSSRTAASSKQSKGPRKKLPPPTVGQTVPVKWLDPARQYFEDYVSVYQERGANENKWNVSINAASDTDAPFGLKPVETLNNCCLGCKIVDRGACKLSENYRVCESCAKKERPYCFFIRSKPTDENPEGLVSPRFVPVANMKPHPGQKRPTGQFRRQIESNRGLILVDVTSIAASAMMPSLNIGCFGKTSDS
ncbi:hypothetical protein BKA63DRAFT_490900 [Paraphoma chrysanthemicola]|nr:hypothetical protein BKA63DRAFT_490900 [Paraphoma chrysanthemicola]